MSDQSSMRSFCSGVPVMSRRRCDAKLSSVCQRWLFQFLIMCASSRIRYFHFLRRNILASCARARGNGPLARAHAGLLASARWAPRRGPSHSRMQVCSPLRAAATVLRRAMRAGAVLTSPQPGNVAAAALPAAGRGGGGRARLQHERVGRDADVERVGLGPALALGLALLGAAEVGEQLEGRAPLLALHLPVQHHARRHHDQVRAPHAPAPRARARARDPGRPCAGMRTLPNPASLKLAQRLQTTPDRAIQLTNHPTGAHARVSIGRARGRGRAGPGGALLAGQVRQQRDRHDRLACGGRGRGLTAYARERMAGQAALCPSGCTPMQTQSAGPVAFVQGPRRRQARRTDSCARRSWGRAAARTEAHLVGQDAVQAARVDAGQPVQADVLVLAQAAL